MAEIEVRGFKPNTVCTISFVCSNCKLHVSPDDTVCKHCGDKLQPSDLLRKIHCGSEKDE